MLLFCGDLLDKGSFNTFSVNEYVAQCDLVTLVNEN